MNDADREAIQREAEAFVDKIAKLDPVALAETMLMVSMSLMQGASKVPTDVRTDILSKHLALVRCVMIVHINNINKKLVRRIKDLPAIVTKDQALCAVSVGLDIGIDKALSAENKLRSEIGNMMSAFEADFQAAEDEAAAEELRP